MAVHAQHPSSLLLVDRTAHQENNKERMRMRMDLRFSDSVRKILGKRTREDMMVPTSLFSGQLFYPQPVNGTHQSALVSTGLCLSLDEQQQFHMNQNTNSTESTRFSSELAAQMARQNSEIEQFLIQQREQLRQAVAEKRRRHYNALILTAEEMVARKIREKEAELNRAAHLTVELQERLNQLRSESAAWQTKARADQATATTLHAQLQQQATAPVQRTGDCEAGSAEDAESGFIDPSRVEPDRSCRACRLRSACVVVFPCRHLCLCEGCEVASTSDGDVCPVCCCVRSGSLKVFFS